MDRTKTITVGCGIWGPVLSAMIIAARAVCGSVPMEEWSVWSWFLMTLPITIPFVAFLSVCIFCAGAYLISEAILWILRKVS